MQAYCCYKLPQQSDFYELKGSVISLQNNSEINNKTGFVFAPFNQMEDKILFVEGHFTRGLTIQQLAFPKIDLHIKTTSESAFEVLFNKAIAEIKSQNAEKIVISKIKVIDSPTAFNPLVFIKKLAASYPNAFVYLFATETQCWMGASPEVLLTYENDLAETVSLAGTISEDQSQRFSEKEREEQAIITSYIEKTLSKFDIKAVSKSMPKPVQAGLLTHLQTQFSFSVSPNKIHEILEKLHPTPAVCGMPKAFSKEFILQNESHQRAYYSGFLGPVSENRFSLFVNLRCAQIFKESMILYAGAGITKDSVYIKEWEETEAKFGTILNELKDYSS